MFPQEKPIARGKNIVVQELENETLIYDLEINKVFCLNQTSALVWRSCDGKKTIIEIARLLQKKFKSEVNEDLVNLALNDLGKNNLLENQGDQLWGEVKRREVIKKVGLTTMLALPLVSGLIAPSAVEAQSGNICSCPTSTSNNCLQTGSFSLGCFTFSQDCFREADLLGGNVCCNGIDGIAFDIATGCCRLDCFSGIGGN